MWKTETKVLSEGVGAEQQADEVQDVRTMPGSKQWNPGISQSHG